ncbi:MAG: UDP-N-acetylmuramate dehydrogenase [Deltaproteobacteria bacterium]|nr:UDP-N-acetylmuramate dehydrogenase [Deltaproteobacteria bacterium]
MRSSAGLQFNEPLCRHTRIGIGGPAALLARAHTPVDVRDAVTLCREKGWPLMMLGRGSNLLVPDEGFQGCMLKLAGDLSEIVIDTRNGIVKAGGGASLMGLGLLLARQGYPGCTYMGVIPGSVGGAVRMNAGIAGAQAIEKNFLRALALDPATGEIVTLEKNELGFGYRTSCLAACPLIILEAVFRLPQETVPAQETLRDLQALLRKRHGAQPRCYRTFGSTFKNPPGPLRPAGWYLEQVGMQGMRINRAMVAREHANWILNTGGATSAAVAELMRIGRTRVFEQFGVHLAEEVVVVPPSAPAMPN